MRPRLRGPVPLLPGLALVGGGVAMLVDGARLGSALVSSGIDSVFNDFYDYWGAAVLLNRGGNPYDVGALTAVLHAAGLHTEVGGGYSYPLLLAQLMRPLGLLTPHTAALVFSAISVLALGLATSLILGAFRPLRLPFAVIGALVIAGFPPVMGSLYYGQVNVVVLVPLALAWRLVLAGPFLAVAAAVKLYPVIGFLADVTRPTKRSLKQLGWAAAILAALVVLPQLGARGSFLSQGGALLAPDTYWTNASVNGVVSRLSIASTWTTPPLAGLPVGAVVAAVCAILAAATFTVLLRAREVSASARLALCLWLGVVIAPKDSYWNFAPLVLALASVWQLRGGRWWPVIVAGLGLVLIHVQSELDISRATVYSRGAGMTWLSGLALCGALMIGVSLGSLLLLRDRRSRATVELPPAYQAAPAGTTTP